MTSPLDKIPPKLQRAPYEVDVEGPLLLGSTATITVRPVAAHRSVGPVEVAIVCRAIDDGELLAEVATTIDPDGGTVDLAIPDEGPATAEGDEIVNAWAVLVRATDGRRRNLALPTPIWVGVADETY